MAFYVVGSADQNELASSPMNASLFWTFYNPFWLDLCINNRFWKACYQRSMRRPHTFSGMPVMVMKQNANNKIPHSNQILLYAFYFIFLSLFSSLLCVYDLRFLSLFFFFFCYCLSNVSQSWDRNRMVPHTTISCMFFFICCQQWPISSSSSSSLFPPILALDRNQIDKRTILENLDYMLLIVDELIDEGYATIPSSFHNS